MKIAIEDGVLIIEMPVNQPLVPSKTGKSYLVATSNGVVKTDLIVDGKPLKVGVNCFIDKQ